MEARLFNKDHATSEGVVRHYIRNATIFIGTSLSEPVIIRHLEWRILVKTVRPGKTSAPPNHYYMGFFLQCGSNAPDPSWSCYARAELKLVSRDPRVPDMSRKISHLFHEKENDWGMANFKLWSEIIDPANGYIKDDCVTLEAHVEADLPHGVNWDSKKLTGYVGLKNQGATCYMNSLLQTLFFTNQFRKAVYQIPFRSTSSVSFALQSVFYGLQFSEIPVDTRILTNSFGWKTSDTLRQQDVHEFLRLLIDKLEGTIENVSRKGAFSNLFEGEMISTVKCRHIDYISSITEPFYDVQLNIMGKSNILESLDEYVAPEMLMGDNRYAAGQHGLQEAEKKVTFSRFPPVLYLHLMRFQYDSLKDCSVKNNSRVEFPEQLHLSKYLLDRDSATASYSLHSVLVHSGNNKDGHYVVYINPELRGDWYIFDDDVVCRVSKIEAIRGNFGGEESSSENSEEGFIRACRNAYVLVYIQQSQSGRILQAVGLENVPADLLKKLSDTANSFPLMGTVNPGHTQMQVVLEDSFTGYLGKNLFDPKTVCYIPFYIFENAALKDIMEVISKYFKFPKDQFRIWPLNEDSRPIFLKNENAGLLASTIGFGNPWLIFLELLPPDSGKCSLPNFDPTKHVLIFFKAQLRNMDRIIYCGYHYVLKSLTAVDIMKILNEMIFYPEETIWKLYLNLDEKIVDEITVKTFSLQNGDVIVFKEPKINSENDKALEELCKDMNFPTDVTICDLLDNCGTIIKTAEDISYIEFVQRVANKLNMEHTKLQVFIHEETSRTRGDLSCFFKLNLKNLFVSEEPYKRKIYYNYLTEMIERLKTTKKKHLQLERI